LAEIYEKKKEEGFLELLLGKEIMPMVLYKSPV
jgi:hypothetical protein